MSNALPNQKSADVMTALADKEIQRRTEIKRERPIIKECEIQTPISDLKKSSIRAPGPAIRKAIKPNLRKTIFKNDQCCQFKDPLTDKICGSVRFLEIDHIQPIWSEGDNSADNLRILCSQHNKFKYANESGSHPLRW